MGERQMLLPPSPPFCYTSTVVVVQVLHHAAAKWSLKFVCLDLPSPGFSSLQQISLKKNKTKQATNSSFKIILGEVRAKARQTWHLADFMTGGGFFLLRFSLPAVPFLIHPPLFLRSLPPSLHPLFPRLVRSWGDIHKRREGERPPNKVMQPVEEGGEDGPTQWEEDWRRWVRKGKRGRSAARALLTRLFFNLLGHCNPHSFLLQQHPFSPPSTRSGSLRQLHPRQILLLMSTNAFTVFQFGIQFGMPSHGWQKKSHPDLGAGNQTQNGSFQRQVVSLEISCVIVPCFTGLLKRCEGPDR